jgi:hypothetical protein
MDMVSISMLTVPNMKENGEMTSNMVLVLKNGLMAVDTKDITKTPRSKVTVDITGPMATSSLVSGTTTPLMAKESMCGLTEESTAESGNKT